MLTKLSVMLPITVLLMIGAQPGNASLVGSSVSGLLSFAGDPSNYFDPAYGFVPGSYLNASGTTVTVSNTAVEFGYDDGVSLLSADFLDNHLKINDTVETSGSFNGFQMVFTDAALGGQQLVAVSDDFNLQSYSVAGDVLTVDYAGGDLTAGQTFSAEFLVTPTAEPSSLSLLGLCLLSSVTLVVLRRVRN